MVLIIEPQNPDLINDANAQNKVIDEIINSSKKFTYASKVQNFLWHPHLPTDIRHNAKIFREKLALWAATQILQSRRSN